MQSFCRSLIGRRTLHNSSNTITTHFKCARAFLAISSSKFGSFLVPDPKNRVFESYSHVTSTKCSSRIDTLALFNSNGGSARLDVYFPSRNMSTALNVAESTSTASSEPIGDVSPRIKFKRLDKTARHIMQILDKEAVEEVRKRGEIPDIRPGHIVQLKVEVPENKRRISTMKGIVIARRNAGLNTTIRLRRLVAGVGVESLFPLYSPNIKEIEVLEKKKVRRAKLYYLRDKMNALKK